MHRARPRHFGRADRLSPARRILLAPFSHAVALRRHVRAVGYILVVGCAATSCGARTELLSDLTPRIDLPVPRLLAPISSSFVDTQHPLLRWQTADGIAEVRIEICRDHACAHVEDAFFANGASTRTPHALTPGFHFWRATSATSSGIGRDASASWELYVPHRDPPNGTAWGTMMDLNGDGYSELAVFGTNAAQQDLFYVYDGSATGLPRDPSATITGTGPHGTYPVGDIGDVNGDGYDDFAATENVMARNAYVYFGGPEGIAATPDQMIPVDGFDVTALSAGDLNHDGYGDAVLCAPLAQNSDGAVYVYFGSAMGLQASPAATIAPPEDGAREFGQGAAVADVNGDGETDLIVGAPWFQGVVGRAYVYMGSGVGLGTTPSAALAPSAADGGFFGTHVIAGDFNGDGFGDVAVSAWRADAFAGRVYLYYGSVSGLPTAASLVLREADGQPSALGDGTGGGGDMNGDGYDELVAAEALRDSATGRALVFAGTESGLTDSPVIDVDGSVHGDWFGIDTTRFRDFDGDTLADVALSAVDIPGPPGSVHVLYGSAERTAVDSEVLATPSPGIDGFGYIMAFTRFRADARCGGVRLVIESSSDPCRIDGGRDGDSNAFVFGFDVLLGRGG